MKLCGLFLCPQQGEFQNVSNLTPKCVKSEICKRPSFCYHIVSSRDKPTEPKQKHLSARPRTNKKNIVSPILEQAKDTIAEPTAQQNDLLVLEVCKWDHSTYLWNRAFCVSKSSQMVGWLIAALVSFPPRSPGERTKQ